ncbi:carbohydrate ABC transporter permease [Cohnella sp. 56]|uniref:carbohydrate ABC transporter permease n=1 Tax=Cohnella sp. 56 TaxID=3113722 RepID=UPI0030EA1074
MIQATKNTAYFLVATLLIGNPLFIGLALALNRPLRTRGLLRTVYYLPQIMSIVVMSMIWGAILQYDGIVNALLHGLGLDGWVRDWFGSRRTAMNAMILFNTWQSAGFGAIIVLAGLQAIPRDAYEAARIEGAAGWKSFRYITLPLLAPSITIINFLLLIGGLKYFEAPLILTNGGPGGSTMTISLLIYRIAFKYQTLGYATAAGVLFFVVIAICTLALLHFSRKKEVEY